MLKEPILLIMAAGMGSRYGGLKQMDPLGPDGESILDYSVFDARRAGFRRVIFLIKHEIESDFRRLVDIFINAVYVYDDRIIVFYNIRGGKQVSSKDLYEALESPQHKENSKPETGSDLESSGGAGGIRTHGRLPVT